MPSIRSSNSEHLALRCVLDLQGFCARLQEMLGLPAFVFDHENETEWGRVEMDNIEYNVSRPFRPGTLQGWDDTVPPDCNFGISLIVFQEHPHFRSHEWVFDNLVIPVGQKIADSFQVAVHYHRTSQGTGLNVKRNLTFHPKRA